MKRALLIAAVCAPLVAACATATPRTPQLALPAAFEAPTRGAALPAASLDRWWALYNDPQLTALVEEALGRSFDVREAAARLEQARAVRAGQSAQLFLPQGSLSTSATRRGGDETDFGQSAGSSQSAGPSQGGGQGFSNNGDTYSADFNVSWELDLVGRRRAAQKTADANLRTAEFTYEATRWSLAANVADSLFQARGLAIQLDQAEETLRIQRALYGAAKAKSDRGLVASSDAAQTQASVQTTEAQAESLQAQLNAARRSLLLLLGRATDPLANLPVPPSVGTPPQVPGGIPGELLARRPDVREAQWRLASAAGQLTTAQLALFPTFKLSPGLGVTKLEGQDSSGSWSLGVSATVPILDIPRLLTEIRAQKAVSEQQVLAYERAVQTAFAEAENALVYLDADNRRVRLLRAAERNAAVAYDAKRIGYSRGFNDLQTALNAETTWRQARQSLASAEVTAMQRSVQVFKALGGGWTPSAPGRELPPATEPGRSR